LENFMDQFTFLSQLSAPLSVTEVTQHVRLLLENDTVLQDLWVEGEVSNVSVPKSGHLYCTLKDAGASLRIVMWKPLVNRLAHIPRDGEAIEVHGSVSVYEAGGQYQLYADTLRPAGEGKLYQEFIRLKARLEDEGLFDPQRKRTIPGFPSMIGIVTSPTGAALRDILNTINRRFPIAEAILSPTAVQGESAPDEIVAAIERLNAFAKPDVILIARGGGSIEDLWAFNDEKVARAIADSSAPVISGVGHETDFTIADFVADLRAPTPTAAAELATPDKVEIRSQLAERALDLHQSLKIITANLHWELKDIEKKLVLFSPLGNIRSQRQQLDGMSRRADTAVAYYNHLLRIRLEGAQQQMEVLSPSAVLNRGYAVITHSNGQIINSKRDIETGDRLDVTVSDGHFNVEVKNI
jgi:exodeoxyribonuclease VII large subunit